MKANREQMMDKLMVIKLFTSNYARDLLLSLSFLCIDNNDNAVRAQQLKQQQQQQQHKAVATASRARTKTTDSKARCASSYYTQSYREYSCHSFFLDRNIIIYFRIKNSKCSKNNTIIINITVINN